MVKLTEFSPGAGCGCKMSPQVLQKILKNDESTAFSPFSQLLVGYEHSDDAAVWCWQGDDCIISTTDFFTPIVDDAREFGRIAATNAISDVYAMGGRPSMAIGILGWPLKELPVELCREVLMGAREICHEANIPLAGGHSIDIPVPIFGLAVTGTVKRQHIKQNGGAKAGDKLYLTKPLGVGILSTAEKRGVLKEADRLQLLKSMTSLNRIGEELGKMKEVTTMTDVTGFGFLGHLLEMCRASKLAANVNFEAIPLLSADMDYYLEQKTIPGGTTRNFDSYGMQVMPLSDRMRSILCDPQTSGGLLVAVDPLKSVDVEKYVRERGVMFVEVGHFTEKEKEGLCKINVAR